MSITTTAPTGPLPIITEDDLPHLAHIDPEARVRVLIERAIVRRAIETLLAAGYRLAVHDVQSFAADQMNNVPALMAAIMASDHDVLHVYRRSPAPGGSWATVGWVAFAYGRGGCDVVSDHTMNLEGVLAPVVAYAESLSAWC